MNFFKKTARFLAVTLVLATSVSLLAACKSDSNDVYTKEFPDVNEIEYNISEYLKAPKLSDIKLRKSRIDNFVNYALVSILLQKAERTAYKEANSAQVALYDTVNLTFTGVPADESVELDDMILASMSNASSSSGTNLVIGSGSFIGEYYNEKDPSKNNKGFEEQLVGMNVGESKDILVTFPDTYAEKSLCSVVVKFSVKINSIDRPTLGELTDEACKAYTGYETVEAYTEYLEEYYSGVYAYDAVYGQCEIIKECKEIVDVYVDKYIHDNIIYSYGESLTQKDYEDAYEELYDSIYDKAYSWAVSIANERIILKYLFDNCSITLSEEEFDEMFATDWEDNKDAYKSNYGIETKEDAIEYFGRDELELSYMFEKMIKVLPDHISIVE